MSWAGSFQGQIGTSQRPSNEAEAAVIFDPAIPTLLCLSHLRWSFVYQRPQHLMSRFVRDYNVLFFEEPIGSDEALPWLEVRADERGVQVLVPRLPHGLDTQASNTAIRALLDIYLARLEVDDLLLWYYTPMSLAFSAHLQPRVTIYDCMDELSAFQGAPPELVERERDLLARADLVFTGGHSIWEAKRTLHANAHAFASSVDIAHFAAARQAQSDPPDQAEIDRPRLGFYGVIDERFDIELLRTVATMRPDWQLVMIGPVVKIDPASLPEQANIHYLGSKTYDELPRYLAGWDVALMPFAMNPSTRFISPTKTPEYLAAGRPVVSTPINDVVRSYGDCGLVLIAGTAEEFVAACEQALALAADHDAMFSAADRVLAGMSWDRTQADMKEMIECIR
ncbi:glycosyltransferase involved in cell wall biosynthesis [Pseudomonas sp. BIGb0408]|uniref:Glycosyltransferase involved in cell wall biosynthesis n=1 Tax=Phytopseudomonas flavescens TaxID=29435 RepID=A0A7Z0BQ36_9GAMM|nr:MULTISPECIES: glycosyltransferase family 1 protein [Pseudomonas]MCW2292704.1 glycosyltransferase involved in cell wall biosynthesis [Pseudomonas sp. BIGb0408]NYH72726.1 glycosyltransferase involved in cell wall biosynthesis [Pseudomonas flavescens]